MGALADEQAEVAQCDVGVAAQCFERLDEYVELELRGADADERVPGMRAHLAGCPACAGEHQSLRALLGR